MRKIFILFGAFSVISVSFGQSKYRTELYRGNQSFENQDFEKASMHYLNAIAEDKKDAKAHYNLGNNLYKNNKYADAIASYQNALKYAKNEQEKTDILYNLGNAQLKNNQPKMAAESYQQALKLSPKNERIVYNLRMAKKQIKGNPSPQKNENNAPQPNENEQKTRSEQEENLLKYLEHREAQAAQRATQNRGYAQPQSNQKDW